MVRTQLRLIISFKNMQSQTIIGSQFPKKVIPLVESAQKSIKIVVFDWRWYENDPGNSVQLFNQSVVRAVRRAVNVQAIVNNDGVVSVLQQCGISAKKLTMKGLVHAKLMVIDDKIVILGSHNYTHNAFVVNQEISVILSDCENVADFNLFFDSLWQN